MGRALEQRGGEDETDGIHLVILQNRTPTLVKGKSKFDNVVSSYTPKEPMVATQVAQITELLVAKEIPTLPVDFLDGILQCSYEKAYTEVCSVIFMVLTQNSTRSVAPGSDGRYSRRTHHKVF